MLPDYDESLVDGAVSMISTIATRSAPEQPRIQLEVILLGAVSHAMHQLDMSRDDAYRTLAWLLDELDRRKSSPPALTLVPEPKV